MHELSDSILGTVFGGLHGKFFVHLQQIRHDLDPLCPVARKSGLAMRCVTSHPSSFIFFPPKISPPDAADISSCLHSRSASLVFFQHVYSSIRYPITQASAISGCFLSLESICIVSLQFLEEKSSGDQVPLPVKILETKNPQCRMTILHRQWRCSLWRRYSQHCLPLQSPFA